MERIEFVVVGAGPAGTSAAREAAAAGVETLVLEKDAVVGVKRVCAAGLRPGFCETFGLPRSLVHCDTPRLALFADREEFEVFFGPGHTTTREELDGTMARLACDAGARIRTRSLLRGVRREDTGVVVEYADGESGERRTVFARFLLLAQGATARCRTLDDVRAFDDARWESGLMTTLQYRVYLDRPAAQIAYRTLELHYYRSAEGRQIVAWMFPKRDHLAIGLGLSGKLAGAALREELDGFTERVRQRLYPAAQVVHVKEEGHLLYGGWPRSVLASGPAMIGGTAAGLVDATNGEGIYEAAMSGRLAADAILRHRSDTSAAARAYALEVHGRFKRRLEHRVRLMRFLEARPKRYAMLFEQLASSARFSNALYRENHERSPIDHLVLYAHALRFGVRASLA